MTCRFGVLAYGPNAHLHREATVAILSVKAFAPAATEVVVLTDRASAYRWLAPVVSIEVLSAERLRSWRGPTDDRFRPKLEAIRMLSDDAQTNAVLVDTDTLARRPLEPMIDQLEHGTLFMHTREYLLASPPRVGDRHLPGDVFGRTWDGISPDRATTAMWNSGVIGVSRLHPGVMTKTLAVFDQLRPVSRHFGVEQLACSVTFPTFGPMAEASGWFDHYWANRNVFNRLIERFLSAALLEGLTPAAAAERLRARPISAPLDGRVPWWLARVRRRIIPADPHDDFLEPAGV